MERVTQRQIDVATKRARHTLALKDYVASLGDVDLAMMLEEVDAKIRDWNMIRDIVARRITEDALQRDRRETKPAEPAASGAAPRSGERGG